MGQAAGMTKYRAVRTEIDGIMFASKAEAERYCQLRELVKLGDISQLELQPKYEVSINGQKICNYIADFRYFSKEPGPQGQAGHVVVEDVKGKPTPVYRIKKKLVEALYPGVQITEIKITKRRYVP
jgi:hypothetical protein